MTTDLDDFIDILAEICKDKNVQCTIGSSARGAAIAGTFCGLGGLLLGPVGLAVGGAVGGIVAASTSPKFTSVAQILMNMSEKQKEHLCNKVVYAFRDFGLKDIAAVAAVVMSQNELRRIATEAVMNYFTREMGLKICST